MSNVVIGMLALLLAPAVGVAQVAFSSLGEGKTFSPNAYSIAGANSGSTPQVMATRFTSAATGPLSSVEVALAHFSGTPNAMQVMLHRSNGVGEIGTMIESWTVSNVPLRMSGGGVMTLDSVTGSPLTSGTDYWISVWPGGSGMQGSWMWNPLGGAGPHLPLAFSRNGGATFDYSSAGQRTAFQVNVPEPGCAVGLVMGACAMLLGRRRRHECTRRSMAVRMSLVPGMGCESLSFILTIRLWEEMVSGSLREHLAFDEAGVHVAA
jgi:hypothetical protein